MERATYTIEEAAEILGIGRSSAYQAVRAGDIPTIRVGRRLLVPRMTSASVMASFDPPEGVEEIILAPDNDEAGRKAIAAAVPRLKEQSFRVRKMLPLAGTDWCDALGTFEERAGIRQFDGDVDRQEAERLEFEEVIHGR